MMFFHEGGDVYHAAIFLAWHDGHRVMLDVSGDGDTVEKARPWTDSWYAGTLRGM
jgi:hypothetical protein